MALSFYQKARDSDRLICLSYPYRPLLESYVCPKKVEVKFITFLNCYKSMTNSRKYFDYKKLRDYLDMDECSNFEDLMFNKNLNFASNALLSLLHDFDCDDNSTASLILALYFQMKCNIGPIHLESANNNNSSEEREPPPRREEQERRNIYIYRSIDSCDVKYLQIMLRYGYQCLASEDEYSMAMFISRRFAIRMWNEHRIAQRWEDMYDKLDSYFEQDDETCWRRKYDVIKCLDAVMRKRTGCKSLPDYIECLKLHFSSIPDPYVAQSEMEELIIFLLGENDDIDIPQIVVDNYCSDFAEIFANISTTEFCSPRTLKHLSRCKVRKILVSSIYTRTPIPTLVSILVEGGYIPQELGDYILCEPSFKWN